MRCTADRVGRVNIKISWSTPLYNNILQRSKGGGQSIDWSSLSSLSKLSPFSHSATFFFFRFFYFILRGIVANAAQNTLTRYIYRIIIIIYYLFSTQVDGFCSSFSHVSSFSHSLSFTRFSVSLSFTRSHSFEKKKKNNDYAVTEARADGTEIGNLV